MPFLEAVNAVGGEVQRQGAYVTQAFGAQREMLAAVAERRRPEREEDFVALLEGTTEALACIDQAPARPALQLPTAPRHRKAAALRGCPPRRALRLRFASSDTVPQARASALVVGGLSLGGAGGGAGRSTRRTGARSASTRPWSRGR